MHWGKRWSVLTHLKHLPLKARCWSLSPLPRGGLDREAGRPLCPGLRREELEEEALRETAFPLADEGLVLQACSNPSIFSLKAAKDRFEGKSRTTLYAASYRQGHSRQCCGVSRYLKVCAGLYIFVRVFYTRICSNRVNDGIYLTVRSIKWCALLTLGVAGARIWRRMVGCGHGILGCVFPWLPSFVLLAILAVCIWSKDYQSCCCCCCCACCCWETWTCQNLKTSDNATFIDFTDHVELVPEFTSFHPSEVLSKKKTNNIRTFTARAHTRNFHNCLQSMDLRIQSKQQQLTTKRGDIFKVAILVTCGLVAEAPCVC